MRTIPIRARRAIGVLCLIALIAIGIGVSGLELAVPRVGGDGQPERALPGVRAASAALLVRVGSSAPAGSELAFLAVEPSGNLLVTDRQRQSILRFDATGHLLSEWGPRLGSDVALDEPAGIAVFEDLVVVVDRGTPRLLRLDTTGRLLDVIGLQSRGTYGLNGIAIDADGNLYAADTGRNRLLVFSPAGALLREVGRGGNGLGEFRQPMGLSFAADGSYFVADWENARIERFDAAHNATDAWSVGFRAFGVAVDTQGRVFAPDSERRRVFAYTPRGVQLAEFGGPGGQGLEISPRQLAFSVDQPLALYVLGGQGIVRLDLENEAPPPQQTSGDVDLLSPVLLLVLAAVPIVAVLSRRARRRRASVLAPFERKVGLQPVDRAQGEQQQAGRDQHLVVAVPHQADHEQQPTHQDRQRVRDRQSDHRS